MCINLSLYLNFINFIHLGTSLHSQVFAVIWGAGQLQLAVVEPSWQILGFWKVSCFFSWKHAEILQKFNFLIFFWSNCWFHASLHGYETISCWFNFCHKTTEARIYSSEIVQWKEWGHVGLRDEFATAITRRLGTLERPHCDRTLEWWLVGMTIPRSLISG